MKLNSIDLANERLWKEKNYKLMKFDREKVIERTSAAPEWVHFGGGNIFRAYIAMLQQEMLDSGKAGTGIIVAEGYDYEIIDKFYRPHDNLSLAVTLHSDGSIDKTVVGSVTESLIMDPDREDWKRLKEIFEAPSLQMASFTITEKGYNLRNQKGEIFPAVQSDFERGPSAPESYIGKVAALCYFRFLKGRLPIAMVSMDNCSHNGTRLYNAVNEFAEEWEARGYAKKGFAAYINDESKVSFPWSMIDKITPRPDDKVKQILISDGYEDADPVVTSKDTYIATFVNAEETQYLVIENKFPNGRPALEERGVIFTEREIVDKVEKMKVCTCLNPLHTALAVYGCLLGYKLISQEMKDPQLKKLVETIGYVEGLPVVVDPGIIDPKEFIDTVIQIRFPNPFMPDTPQRIATDTSQKLGIRYGETIKSYLKREDLSVSSLKLIPLVFAGWCRYLLAVGDDGEPFEPSPDPMLKDVQKHLEGIKLGDKSGYSEKLKPILSNSAIFGVDLYEVGLGELVEKYFGELIAGKGAVRNTLKKYVV